MLAEDGKLSVVALAGRIGISAKAVEKHLAKLKVCPPQAATITNIWATGGSLFCITFYEILLSKNGCAREKMTTFVTLIIVPNCFL